MNILVVLAHPDAKSFNHAIAETCKNKLQLNGHHVVFHDLHKENFDPLLPAIEIPKEGTVPEEIESHCKELTESDGIIVIHPNWWGQPPALMKGWIDRVIRPGVAYEFKDGDNGEGEPVGLLKARTGIVFNTSNTSQKREIEIFKDPLEAIWKNCIFDLCGVQQFERRMFSIIVTSTLEQRKLWLNEVSDIIDRYFPGK